MQLNHEKYSGWGRVLSASGGRARPEKSTTLAEFVAQTPGPAIGALRSYGDAALSSARAAVDMSRLDRLISFDETSGILEAEAGVPLSDIMQVFSPRGWMPAVLPGTGFATLGGAIAADVHGKNHHGAGTFGASVQEITLIGADGVAQTVLPDSDLFRATVGGMGLTGVISRARIKLAPCPSGFMDVRLTRANSLAAFLEAFESSTATYSVGWIDATARGASLGRGILEEAEHTTRPAPFAKPVKSRPVPFEAPSFLLSGPVVRVFNAMYLRRLAITGTSKTTPLPGFFHPLDGLTGWNKLYGRKGFHQFQCVLPPDSAAITLDTMLRRIAGSGRAAPLAVLKKMGPARSGWMSFPMEGYTLAVDFQNRPDSLSLIDGLNQLTVEAGGRVYLAKDSTARASQLAAMYPEAPTFAAFLRDIDPDGVFETDLARRLNLRGMAQ